MEESISKASVFFRKLPRKNNRPLGENSPNLVTLLAGSSQKATL
jgi:hypothetical protein